MSGPPRRTEELADFYADAYTGQEGAHADRLGRWRSMGARGKADRVQALLRSSGLSPAALVEIGCGDGALLAELSARGVAGVLDGFEVSAPAIEIAASRGVARRLETYDGESIPAGDGAYDLAVLSHVVEHVPEPVPLLREAARVARHVFVEVPLEDNLSAARPAKRAESARIGHVHFFSRADVLELFAAAGLEIEAELTDPLPREHHAFFAPGLPATLKSAARRILWRVAPAAAARLFTLHYAALGSAGDVLRRGT